MSTPRSPFMVVAPRAAHPLTNRKAVVRGTAQHASRQMIGQTVTILDGAASSYDGDARVKIGNGTISCVARIVDLDLI